MVFSRLFANESLLGVDIGSSNIKIVHAESTKQGTRLSHFVMCPTPPESVKEGVIVNVPEVAAAIQFALRSMGIRASSAVVAVAGPGVMVRHVQFPRMAEQVLRKTIQFEAGKYISASVEDSVIEFEILGDAQEEGQMNVVLAAAPRAMIDSKVAALEAAGLEPVAVDVEVFSALRALIERNPDQSLLEGTVAVLDIGASHTEINLVSRGSLALTRTIPIAGTSLTNAIRNAEGCSDEEAEQRKHSLDMSGLSDEPGGSPSLRVVQSLIDELLREIRRSVNYYQSQLPEGATEMSVDRLIMTGGTARLKGLIPYTSSRLNIQVDLGNAVVDNMASSDPSGGGVGMEDMPLFTVALGLAMKEISKTLPLSVAA